MVLTRISVNIPRSANMKMDIQNIHLHVRSTRKYINLNVDSDLDTDTTNCTNGDTVDDINPALP